MAIIILGLSTLGGCKPKEQQASVETQQETPLKESDDLNETQLKQNQTIEDLFYNRDNYGVFAQAEDSKALLSVGDETTYKAGSDLPAGEYIAVCNKEYAGSVDVTKDGDTESTESIISQDSFYVSSIFKIKEGQYMTARDVNIYPIEGVFEHPKDGVAYLPGMFKVGSHLPEGEYIAIGEYASLKVYSAEGISYSHMVFQLYEDETNIVTIKNGQYLKTESCLLYPMENVPGLLKERKAFTQGIHKVGVTIPAGDYTARTTENSGRITLYEDSLYNDNSFISYINVEPEANVTLIEGQYVKIEYAELKIAEGASRSRNSQIEQGPAIVFNADAKPILSSKEDATYQVGKEIQPGEYMVLAQEHRAYVEVNDKNGEMVANDFFNHCSIIDLEMGQTLKINRCDVYEINNVPYVPKKDGGYLEGMYKIGTHIPAGEYMAVGKNNTMYSYSDKTWEWESQEGVAIINNYAIMTLEHGQYLEFVGDGAFYPIDMTPPLETVDGIYKSGMYKVGTHMPAGIYEGSAIGADGYVVISKDSKNQRSSEISTTKIEEKEQFTLTEGQYVTIYGASLVLKEKKTESSAA